ncbi:MAG: hypothetical protein ACTID4_14945 [Hafnia alvei]|uniref:hypothetical protein n=1 Tax=Hafnia alvei TaxID=569 RepID=UPI003F9200B8
MSKETPFEKEKKRFIESYKKMSIDELEQEKKRLLNGVDDYFDRCEEENPIEHKEELIITDDMINHCIDLYLNSEKYYPTGYDEETNKVNSARIGIRILVDLGFTKSAVDLYKMYFKEKVMKAMAHTGSIDDINSILEMKKRQKNIASTERNKNKTLAVKIIKDTWDKYPEASQTRMQETLHEYFKGSVSKSTLLRWIKETGIKPIKGKKSKTFSLVIPL